MARQSPGSRFTRAVAVLLLLSAPLLFQHVGQDDFACAAAAVDEGGARTIAAHRPGNADHCVICHWARSLRSSSATVTLVESVFVGGADVEPLLTVLHRAPALARSPARAPPAAL